MRESESDNAVFACYGGPGAVAKLPLGNKDEPQRIEEKWQVLASRDVSSFAIDNLRDL